jgi:CRP/FNR family transcriptional regulator, cyclic AMP receptor protein
MDQGRLSSALQFAFPAIQIFMDRTHLLNALTTDPWFAGLARDHQTLLLDRAHLRTVANRGVIYSIGEAPDGLYAMVTGEARLVNYPEPGLELLNLVVRPGNWFGELGVIDEEPRPHDAVCVRRSTVLCVSRHDFGRLAARTPEIYRDIARLVCRHHRAALAHMGGALMLPPVQRLARWLLYHASGQRKGGMRINQTDLAGAIGVSRQTLNKMLRSMECAGALRVGYATIEITDKTPLRAVAHL